MDSIRLVITLVVGAPNESQFKLDEFTKVDVASPNARVAQLTLSLKVDVALSIGEIRTKDRRSIEVAIAIPGGYASYPCTACEYAAVGIDSWVPWPAPGTNCFQAAYDAQFSGGNPPDKARNVENCA